MSTTVGELVESQTLQAGSRDEQVAIATIITFTIITIPMIIFVITRWKDDVTGFVSVVVERLDGIFLVLRPEQEGSTTVQRQARNKPAFPDQLSLAIVNLQTQKS